MTHAANYKNHQIMKMTTELKGYHQEPNGSYDIFGHQYWYFYTYASTFKRPEKLRTTVTR